MRPVFKACIELMDCGEYFIAQRLETLMKGIEGSLLVELDEEHVMVDDIIKRYLSGDEYSFICKLYSFFEIVTLAWQSLGSISARHKGNLDMVMIGVV